jgi:hypothetical protein
MLIAEDILLCEAEIKAITGYRQAASQLKELHAQGFYRARRAPTTGKIVLERAHYDAICQGRPNPANAPKLRLPK